MDLAKKGEVTRGKKKMQREEGSCADESDTPQGMQGTNFIPRMTLAMMPKAALTWALEVTGEVCEDAIAADFDEMRNKIKK
jgi:hypothetical protein